MLLKAILWLRSILISIPLIVLGTGVTASLGIVLSWFRPRSVGLDRIKKTWARLVLSCAFVRLQVQGQANIPSDRAVLFCSNHLSYLDPPALVVASDRPVQFLAKQSLFHIPFLGWAMRRMGDISIDRENPRAAARSLRQAAAATRAGASIIVFPEGSRSRDGQLQPFLSGAFRMAIQAQVPVVPVAIRGSRAALRPGSLLFLGGGVRITFGEPIAFETLALKGPSSMANRVEQVVRQLLAADESSNGGNVR